MEIARHSLDGGLKCPVYPLGSYSCCRRFRLVTCCCALRNSKSAGSHHRLSPVAFVPSTWDADATPRAARTLSRAVLSVGIPSVASSRPCPAVLSCKNPAVSTQRLGPLVTPRVPTNFVGVAQQFVKCEPGIGRGVGVKAGGSGDEQRHDSC